MLYSSYRGMCFYLGGRFVGDRTCVNEVVGFGSSFGGGGSRFKVALKSLGYGSGFTPFRGCTICLRGCCWVVLSVDLDLDLATGGSGACGAATIGAAILGASSLRLFSSSMALRGSYFVRRLRYRFLSSSSSDSLPLF